MQKLKIRHYLVAPYHPQSNSKIKQFNRLLAKILTKIIIRDFIANWDNYLPTVLYATRIRSHIITGLLPFYLIYRRYLKNFELGWA